MRFFKSQNVFKKTTTKEIINTNNNNNNDNDNNVNLQPLFVCCSKTSVSFFFSFIFTVLIFSAYGLNTQEPKC